MRNHAEFGRSALKGVGINTREQGQIQGLGHAPVVSVCNIFIMLLLVALFGLAFVICDIMVVVAYFLYLCDSA